MLGIRQILVGVRDAQSGRVPLQTALLVAKTLRCRATVLHVRRSPWDDMVLSQYGLSGAMAQELMEAAERDADRVAEATREMVAKECEAAGVGMNDDPPAAEPSARFITAAGQEETVIPARVRAADLAVLGRGRGDIGDAVSREILHAVLLHSGRPVLLAPQQAPASIGHRVVVAWNGSVEATRALTAALPFLETASSVVVIAAADQEEGGDLDDAEAFLAAHAVACQTWTNTNPGSPAERLLRECDARDADLLVMGAYTHWRLREVILGGFTRHVLAHAAIPVLMTH